MKHYVSKFMFKPKLGRHVTLYGWPTFSENVEIGDYSFINDNNFLRNVSIGRFCSIAEGLQVGLLEHPYTNFSSFVFSERPSPIKKYFADQEVLGVKHTKIGNDVWIGANVTIKSGVTIGDGAVIGSKSMVTKDVPSFAIFAGCPAEIIKYRFSEEKIIILQSIKWWDWEPSKIYACMDQLERVDEALKSNGIKSRG